MGLKLQTLTFMTFSSEFNDKIFVKKVQNTNNLLVLGPNLPKILLARYMTNVYSQL